MPRKNKTISGASVRFRLSVKQEGLEPILGAAYLMMDRAYVALDGDRKRSLIVALRPKRQAGSEGLQRLAAAFETELASQKIRWAIAKNNQPIREYLAEQAVLLAQGRVAPPAAPPAAASPAAEQLSDDQCKEIEKLIAEVEEEIKAMNQKKASPAADPKNIKATWEERQQTAGESRGLKD